MDLNKVMLIGRLTKDPELRTTPSGVNVCTLSVATNSSYFDKNTNKKIDNTEFHTVVLWRKLAEIANQYLSKGRQVYIEGKLQTRSWDAQDGTKKYRTEVVGDEMIMFGEGNKQSAPARGQQEMPVEDDIRF